MTHYVLARELRGVEPAVTVTNADGLRGGGGGGNINNASSRFKTPPSIPRPPPPDANSPSFAKNNPTSRADADINGASYLSTPHNPNDDSFVTIPSMGSFGIVRSLSSRLKLDNYELRSISSTDHSHYGEDAEPSESAETMDSIRKDHSAATSRNSHSLRRGSNGHSEPASLDGKAGSGVGLNKTLSYNSHHGRNGRGVTRSSDVDRKSELDGGLDGDDWASNHEPNDGVLSGYRLALVFLALLAATFMFSLDQSIVATAIPRIVSDFESFQAVPWVITAYFLTQCGLILLGGQLLTVVKPKWVLLGAVFFFELGSLLCALAKSMTMLIVARAIQGIGSAALYVSVMAVIAVVTTVEKRAMFMSGFGLAFVISSVVGPLLGGVFTQQLTWRWCFWINLPIGGIAAALIVIFLPGRAPERHHEHQRTGLAGLLRMDWLGSALSIACVTCLLIALQWGGNDYKWSNWRIILLFILTGVIALAFVGWEHFFGVRALIPPGILRNRTIVAASGCSFMIMLALLAGTYQLPLYYQVARGHSAQKSGIDIIPFMVFSCFGIFISSGFVTKYGHYYPFFWAGPPIAAAGFGLLYTVHESTSNAKLIGYQIISGYGIGLVFQNIILSVQAEYARKPALLPQAMGVLSFFQMTGAAVGIGIVNAVQSIYLNDYLAKAVPPQVFPLVRSSTEMLKTLPEPTKSAAVHAYAAAISKSYIPVLVAISIGFCFGVFVRAHNMLKVSGGAIPAAA